MTTQKTAPRKNLIKSTIVSWMNYMLEEVIYDRDRAAFVRFKNRFVPPDLTNVEQDEEEYVCQSEWERLDKIAHAYYGDERLWWVIAIRNGMELPDQSIYKGRTLKIPSPGFVQEKIIGKQDRVLRREP